jgi:hypothetical protein
MLAIAVMALVLMSGAARAMDVVPAGDQLILSGPVIGDDYHRVAALLASRPAIRTIILRDSPGGHAESGYRLGELFRTKGLDTAVSGFCYSSCSRMFLGGRERRFTDDLPAERTQVGFHGHYGRDGRLLVELIRRLGLKAWIIRHSDGKADAALVERWINLPRSAGLIHFFHPALARQHGAATFICQGDERSPAGVFGCEPIDRTALDLGVITSLDIVHGNDRQRPEPARQ